MAAKLSARCRILASSSTETTVLAAGLSRRYFLPVLTKTDNRVAAAVKEPPELGSEKEEKGPFLDLIADISHHAVTLTSTLL